jgi:malonyl-CoA O-methyltransferase
MQNSLLILRSVAHSIFSATQMSPTHPIPLVSAHVARQFARRGDLAAAQFLYAEISQRMLERLRYFRLQPCRILDAGCGAGANLPLLHSRYPGAEYVGLDHCPALLDIARQRYATAGWRDQLKRVVTAWLRRPPDRPQPHFIEADLATSPLPPESIDLVWSNLALHWHPQPHRVFAEWQRVLKTHGLVIFSCLGPATLRELRLAVATAQLQTTTLTFVDMHDFGDLLMANGFTDPVMEQETLTLTYETPLQLLKDIQALGGNPTANRKASLSTPAWRDRLCAALETQRNANGKLSLTIEIAYGHAWRASTHRTPTGEVRLPVSAIRGRRPLSKN